MANKKSGKASKNNKASRDEIIAEGQLSFDETPGIVVPEKSTEEKQSSEKTKKTQKKTSAKKKETDTTKGFLEKPLSSHELVDIAFDDIEKQLRENTETQKKQAGKKKKESAKKQTETQKKQTNKGKNESAKKQTETQKKQTNKEKNESAKKQTETQKKQINNKKNESAKKQNESQKKQADKKKKDDRKKNTSANRERQKEVQKPVDIVLDEAVFEEAGPRDFDDGEIPINTELKGFPKFLSLFIPTQNDGISEIIQKGLLVICLVIIAVSMVVLVKSTKQPKGEDDIGSNFVTKYVYSYQINENQSTENG